MSEMKAPRPNVIFILSDDQGTWALRSAGNREVRTPNLDRLAHTGVRFDNFFCTSPICSPARASILTGKIPSAHGVHDWIRSGNTIARYEPWGEGRLIEYLAGQPGYTDYLAAEGYTCGISGKWHLGDSHHPQKSFEFWEVHARGSSPYYNAPMIKDGEVYEDPRYVTDVITDNALMYLEDQKSAGKPFYLSVHYTAPHMPWERKHHPAEIFDRYHDECPFESVPDGLTPPEWVTSVKIPVETPEKRRIYMSGYYASIEAMDANIGRILDWLEANGLREQTLVCFMSDNGMNMGHHGVYGKGSATSPLNMFEESVKVPCIISQPGSVVQGALCTELLSQYDFMPTLLEYVGIPNPQADSLPGASFVPELRGERSRGHEQVVIYDEFGPVRMVRTSEWKYVHRYPDGPHEFYNIADDPGEEINLVSDAGRAPRIREMRDRLEEWFARYADPALDGKNLPVTGHGQSGLVSGEQIAGDDIFFTKQ